jgi:hypothetical protein
MRRPCWDAPKRARHGGVGAVDREVARFTFCCNGRSSADIVMCRVYGVLGGRTEAAPMEQIANVAFGFLRNHEPRSPSAR